MPGLNSRNPKTVKHPAARTLLGGIPAPLRDEAC